jgi:hypothetical protein
VPLEGRFPGYPPGFLASIDKAVRVLSKDRIQSATDWLEIIRKGEAGEMDASAGAAEAKAAVPAAVSSNMGYIIGAGSVFVMAALFGLWSVLN